MQSWIKFRFSEIAQLFGSNTLTFNFNITKSCEGLQDISPSSLSPCCSWQRQTYDHTKHQMKASLIKISNHSRCYWRQHVLLQSHWLHFVIFIIDHGPPGSESHLISLLNITTESQIKVERIEELFTKNRSTWLLKNSPCWQT